MNFILHEIVFVSSSTMLLLISKELYFTTLSIRGNCIFESVLDKVLYCWACCTHS